MASQWRFMHGRTGGDPAKTAPAAIPTQSPRETLTCSRAARCPMTSAPLATDRGESSNDIASPILIPDQRVACSEGISMTSLTLSACVLLALFCGIGLFRLALHHRYGLDWPLAFLGVGLVLASASL